MAYLAVEFLYILRLAGGTINLGILSSLAKSENKDLVNE